MTGSQITIRAIWATVTLCTVVACTTNPVPVSNAPVDVPDFASAQIPPPPGVSPDGCWVKDVAPAETRTVTRQVEISPAVKDETGRTVQPARFQTETEQVIVRERQELVFETLCPDALTEEFISSLQRALAARGHYRGAITGMLDTPTRLAIRRYQSTQGLPSGLISIQAARRLGLTTTPRDQL